MKQIRIAAFGSGYFSHFHFDAWARLPGARVVALCGRTSRARAEAVAARYGIPEVFLDPAAMLDRVRPDLVDIITGPESHSALVALAAERRIPIICQKPLAASLAEGRELVRAAESHDTLLVVHENWRFKPWFREIARLLRAGTLGEPYAVTFRMRPGDGRGPDAYLDRQPYFQKMPRFLIHETGIHMIDVFRFLIGEITGVFARLRRLNPAIAGEDAGYVVFDFAGAATGLLDGNRHCAFPADHPRRTMGEFLLEGSEGRVRLDGAGRLWLMPQRGDEREHPYTWSDRGYAGDSVFAFQAHVLSHLLDGTALENRGREYLRNLEVEDAVYRSHDAGRWVTLEPWRATPGGSDRPSAAAETAT